MNDVTAVFLCELAVQTNRQDLFRLLQQELSGWLDARCPVRDDTITKGTLEAERLYKTVQGLQEQVGMINSQNRLQWFREQMEQCAARWNDLRGESAQAMQPGRIPPLEQLHLLTREEIAQWASAIRQQTQIQLYRLLVLGGASALQGIVAPPDSASPEELLAFFRHSLQPALQRIPEQRIFGQWAVEYRKDAKFGSVLRMPGYLLSQPVSGRSPITPGHYQTFSQPGGVRYQGRGLLTNIRPAEIGAAVRNGFVSSCTAKDLDAVEYLDADPCRVLEQACKGRFYAIEPYHYFSVVSYQMNCRVTGQRLARQRCLFCGADSVKEGFHLCKNCFARLAEKSR